jgi:hypothetical protein
MATIVTRAGKGTPLSIIEGDANFVNLNNDKIELTDISVGTPAAPNELGGIAYNNTTGVFTYTPPDGSSLIDLESLSVGAEGTASGDGAIAYDNTTGVFTYTPPDLSSYLTSETFTSVVQDTTPQLGGNLDIQANSIVTSVTNGNVALTANGSGLVVLTGNTVTVSNNITVAGTLGVTGTTTLNDTVINGVVDIADLGSFAETVDALIDVSGVLTVDPTAGPIKYVVPAGAMTINGFSSPVDGQTVTLLIDNGTNATNYGITLGGGLLTPAGAGVTVTDSGYDLVTITCLDSENGVYIVTAVNDFQ